jgi:enamine deaminase RidA (YjgF/YER057c/UK114 family)
MSHHAGHVEEKLNSMGYTLPEPPPPAGSYVPYVRTGNLVYLAGVGPRDADGNTTKGKVGSDLTVEEGYAAARLCALNSLANLKAGLGDLDKVTRVVKVLGMVNGAPDFTAHPAVINGYSDLMVELFGENGRHARSAVGMGGLPGGMAVEVEVIFEVHD